MKYLFIDNPNKLTDLARRITKIFLTIYFMCFSLNITFAQLDRENNLRNIKSKLESKNSYLQKLIDELNEKVNVINQKKSQTNFDKDEIKYLLSNTAQLTNNIEKVQLEINGLSKEYNIVKSELFNIYKDQIDSIKKSNLPIEEKNILTTRIIEKRLYVSPKIDMLSFDPEKVLKIKTTKKSSEQKLIDEFLNSALTEVETKLTEVKDLKKEIETIQNLNKETKTFLEEAEFDKDISYFSSASVSSPSNNLEPSATEYSKDVDNSLRSQSASFQQILTQLEINNSPNERIITLNNITRKKDLNEFKKLILQVEQQLEDYKIVINNKLKK
jgi:hypothetical protein